jgi:hypothetical protein
MLDSVGPWFEATGLPGPKTHALVVGCSKYIHLPSKPGPPDDPARITFGLGQVQTPATSAWQFATWLRDSYRSASAPLGSIRLLLSPSEAEHQVMTDLPSVPRADRTSVADAVQAWYRACNGHPGNVAIMYAAGHGIQMMKDDGGIVLLEDFASLPQTPLDHSLDVPRVRAGMYGEKMARKQFYFIDACQVTAREADSFDRLGHGVSLGSPREGSLDCSMVVSSSAPGTPGFGVPGKGTYFSLALRDCLNGYVAERVPGTDNWGVTTAALMKSVPARVRQVAQERGKEQTAQVGGLVGDAVFHTLASPPLVPFKLHVSPERAAKMAFARLVDERQRVVFERKPVMPAPLSDTLPAGIYTVSLSLDPATPPFSDFTRSFPVDPPESPLTLTFE